MAHTGVDHQTNKAGTAALFLGSTPGSLFYTKSFFLVFINPLVVKAISTPKPFSTLYSVHIPVLGRCNADDGRASLRNNAPFWGGVRVTDFSQEMKI